MSDRNWPSGSTPEQRLGPRLLEQRRAKQGRQRPLRLHGRRPRVYWASLPPLYRALAVMLRWTGLLPKARRNVTGFRVESLQVPLPRLAPAFDGYRVLHLSDLHMDAMPDRGASLRRTLADLNFDLCVITGDFRYELHGDYGRTMEDLAGLMPNLACPDGIWAVLGNHDCLEMVTGLEALGIGVLINEAFRLQRAGAELWLAGVDDPHFFETHDLELALQPVPRHSPRLLLAHSPEIITEAAAAGVDYYLCGHTHGGQVCLPGRIPILSNARCRRRYVSGSWRHGEMLGHTSRGTGAAGLPVRIFCPPEIGLHVLRSAAPAPCPPESGEPPTV